jgi:hypothetical protein
LANFGNQTGEIIPKEINININKLLAGLLINASRPVFGALGVVAPLEDVPAVATICGKA